MSDLLAVRASIAKLLLESKFERRDLQRIVVVATNEQRHIVLRAALAEDLRRSDLRELARECLARRVGPGEILVYGAIENDAGPSVGFVVIPLFDCGARRR